MHRRRSPLLVLLGLTAFATGLLLSPAACPSSPDGGVKPSDEAPPLDSVQPRDAAADGGPGEAPDAGPADGGPDSGPISSVSHGLESRPANPTCVAPARPAEATGVALQRAFPRLTFTQPLFALQSPGDSRRIYVVEKGGRVRVFANEADPASSSLFIDLSGRVNASHDETGLLGMAFHPRFATNGEVFLSYIGDDSEGKLNSYIVRYRSLDGGATLDPKSAEPVLQLYQPWSYHNGGHLAFGPDGYLYIGFGDGGGREDPNRTAQNKEVWLGKLLRIDVDGARPYAIPPGNPYASGGGRKEIYALGFRNPWRWSFDRRTGALWMGDVGEKRYEEVNRVVLGSNHGWSVLEGTACLRGNTCDTGGLTPPVVSYGRGEGVSITGGYVYRGGAVPSLAGQYVYGDFGSGRIWTLPGDAMPGGGAKPKLILSTSLNISSFAELNDGELLVVDFGGGGLHRIVPAQPAPKDTFPTRLSATGCVNPADPTRPAAGLIPYDVNASLWSDGADKERFLAVPDGKKVSVGAEGTLDFPPGSVTVKSFLLGGRRVETRLFMRHPDGSWAGYTYEWNDEGTDAVLLDAGKVKDVAGRTWTFPSRGECMQCHNAASGYVLGLEVAQLNGDFIYPGGRRAHQLVTLEHIGLLALPSEPALLPRLPAYDGPEPLEARARAYLHANCAVCHRPGGLGRGTADLRFSTPLARAGVCDVLPELGELGVPGARLVTPGHPGKSLLSLRMHALEAVRMPPLATRVVDTEGTALVDAWITSLARCPEGL
ncbi:PQQ-dependent sugar dehydrogenase [Myxococcus sp. RHSTA-1-4]|uniref:PQQ-dependent sugar dehydrogenase n=1 Tax=Myxococcus sp. RHSTA-1-4 TaxID=2874601 RepID=UPI001CBCF2C0|nr:PQQ-dependent sugar dehydrogenase [Myxococcus sp. RHSTA-1-4]MBZ4416535.1 PQQ-dependent sugar dehydrogenase [Myxococcus sp. RHSTA-1-4]